jgi:hypothetical protein
VKKMIGLAVLVFLFAGVAQAKPGPAKTEAIHVTAVVPPTGCAGAHCTILTWTASADGAANPTLAYNIFRWPTGGAVSTTPINANPVGAGCSGATCTFTDNTATPGNFTYAATAVLNGAESVKSNPVAVVILPAAPILAGTGQ